MTDSKTTLWLNLVEVMSRKWGHPNINRLSRESGVGLGTVARLKDNGMSIGLDKLDKLAACFGLEPWQLLHPTYLRGSARAMDLSPLAVNVGAALDSITDPEAHQRAYALAVQVVQLANAPVPREPEPAPAAKRTPFPFL